MASNKSSNNVSLIDKEFIQKMDKSIQNKDYNRFLVYFAQYKGSISSHELKSTKSKKCESGSIIYNGNDNHSISNLTPPSPLISSSSSSSNGGDVSSPNLTTTTSNGGDGKNMVFYKSVALLYLLSCGDYKKYFSYVQTCYDIKSYQYVLDIYDFINICDFESLDKILKNSTGIFKEMIQLNIQYLKSQNIEDINRGDVDNGDVDNGKRDELFNTLKECVYVIKEMEE